MNTFLSSLLFPLLLLGSSNAFVAFRPTIKQHSIQSVPKLNDIDLMAIENVAELCLQAEGALVNECDLEEHDALVNQLQAQRNLLVDQVTYLEDLLERLEGESFAP
jgi:hypothetical protein